MISATNNTLSEMTGNFLHTGAFPEYFTGMNNIERAGYRNPEGTENLTNYC
jgi:hypothetical protein